MADTAFQLQYHAEAVALFERRAALAEMVWRLPARPLTRWQRAVRWLNCWRERFRNAWMALRGDYPEEL